MQTIAVSDFDLAATLESGQLFHWHRTEGGFAGLVADEPLFISQPGPDALVVGDGCAGLARRYFALDHDLKSIRGTLPPDDPHLARALEHAPGLRIVRQPRWECLATFITSSLKQVAHIRHMSLTLRSRFGRKIPAPGGLDLFAYPTPQALADAGEQALRACSLGYRAKTLHQTASLIARGEFDLDAVAALDDEAAAAKLCELPGVGPKIAQCVLLFAYERLGAFPIDVWIERALRELYFAKARRKPASRKLREFAWKHFGKYRGYAQQWLFHHARTSGFFGRRRKRD
jgi:N-glycosylase/DNA lyase